MLKSLQGNMIQILANENDRAFIFTKIARVLNFGDDLRESSPPMTKQWAEKLESQRTVSYCPGVKTLKEDAAVQLAAKAPHWEKKLLEMNRAVGSMKPVEGDSMLTFPPPSHES